MSKFITCMILAGTESEDQWTRISVGGFMRHCPGGLLVIDNTRGHGNKCIERLSKMDRVIVIRNPNDEKLACAGLKLHGAGYDVAFNWAKENGYDCMVSLEADSTVTSGVWHGALMDAIHEGYYMAGLTTLSDRVEHHTPAAYDPRVNWPSFDQVAITDDEQENFKDLIDWETKKKNTIEAFGKLMWDTFSSRTFDTGQKAWLWAAMQNKVKHLDLERIEERPGGIQHEWGGSRRKPSPEALAPWIEGKHFGTELLAIFDKNQTDKAKHEYHRFYTWLLAPYRGRGCRLMELGSAFYQSLRSWNEYLPDAHVMGVDKEIVWSEPMPRGGLSKGDLRDKDFRQSLCVLAPFDVLIDDASHNADEQLACFETLWPCVSSGGCYVVEDCYMAQSQDFVKAVMERLQAEREKCPNPFAEGEILRADCITMFCNQIIAFRKIPMLES